MHADLVHLLIRDHPRCAIGSRGIKPFEGQLRQPYLRPQYPLLCILWIREGNTPSMAKMNVERRCLNYCILFLDLGQGINHFRNKTVTILKLYKLIKKQI